MQEAAESRGAALPHTVLSVLPQRHPLSLWAPKVAALWAVAILLGVWRPLLFLSLCPRDVDMEPLWCPRSMGSGEVSFADWGLFSDCRLGGC